MFTSASSPQGHCDQPTHIPTVTPAHQGLSPPQVAFAGCFVTATEPARTALVETLLSPEEEPWSVHGEEGRGLWD